MAANTKIVSITDRLSPENVVLPAIYTKAVAMIKDTITLDESKQWVDKSEALGAWASMYRNDEVGSAAKRLRLHAYRRMGQLAQELQPTKAVRRGGRTPGPNALLRESGLSRHGADAAVALAKAPRSEVDKLIEADKPISPTTYSRRSYANSALAAFRNHQRTPFSCRVFLSEVTPKQAARKLTTSEKIEAVKQLNKLAAWIVEFERACAQTGQKSCT